MYCYAHWLKISHHQPPLPNTSCTLRSAPGTCGLQQLPILQKGNIWIAVMACSGKAEMMVVRGEVQLCQWQQHMSRGRAQQKAVQLCLWTIHPPGQTLEKPVASHQPTVITGSLIKAYHFWLLILHSKFGVGRSAVGTAVVGDIWESTVPDHKKIGSTQQYSESYTCKAVKS